MTHPTARINTFVKDEKKHIDFISKIFIVSEAMFGFGRMPLIAKSVVHVLLTVLICITFNVMVIYYNIDYHKSVTIMLISTIIRSILTSLLSFTRCKWLERYYSELNKFDTLAGCRPKVLKGCIWNVVQATCTCIFITVLHLLVHVFGISKDNGLYVSPLHVIYVLEVSYFGHLLNLLTPRLKVINYYLESSLTSATSDNSFIEKDFVHLKPHDRNINQCQMHKLMNLYQVVVESYDYLIEGIKWQLLVIIICVFITVLGLFYNYSRAIIHNGGVITSDASIMLLGISVTIMVPLFAPCMFGDSVHKEVVKLRELLASWLYENKLDKSGRRTARALLAFSATRNLSFRLLRMLDINISLPFKFVALLVTYLIILLQFEKVINP